MIFKKGNHKMKYRASKNSNNNEEYNPRLKRLIIEVVERVSSLDN